MKTLKTLPFFLAVTTILLISFIKTTPVYATNYEWIQNGGFEEAIGWYTWIPYGNMEQSNNWTCGAQTQFSNTEHHSYNYSMEINGISNGEFHDTLIPPINVSSNFIGSFWVKVKTGTNAQTHCKFLYNDTTSTDISVLVTSTTWIMYNQTLTTGKWVYSVSCWVDSYSGASLQLYIDDIGYIANSQTGQTTIDYTTRPWWSSMDYPFNGISIGTYHLGFCSYYTGSTDCVYSVNQDIGFLDSDKITGISLYAKDFLGTTIHVRVGLLYSDHSYSYKDLPVDYTDGWKYLNFLSGLVLPNKIVVRIMISVTDAQAGYVNIDDVSLTSNISPTQQFFSWSLTPTPIENDNVSFSAYQKIGYVFLGVVYNDSGYAVENGTFSVVSGKGTQSGNIISGVFSFPITTRSYATDTSELFLITITTNTTFIVTVSATWVFVGSGVTPNGDNGVTDLGGWILMFFIIFIPMILMVVGCEKAGISVGVGIITGLGLSIAIGYLTGLCPLWLLFVMVIILIILLLELIHVRGGF